MKITACRDFNAAKHEILPKNKVINAVYIKVVFTNQKCLEVLFFISYFSSFSVGRFCCDTEFYPNKQRLRKRKTLVMADFGRSNRRSLRSMHWLRRDLNSETDIREILGDYFDKNGLSCCYGVIGRINSCADFGSQNTALFPKMVGCTILL